MWIFLSKSKILRMADNCACSLANASLCCSSTTEETQSKNLDSLANALLATLPVKVVSPEGSGSSAFNPVFFLHNASYKE